MVVVLDICFFAVSRRIPRMDDAPVCVRCWVLGRAGVIGFDSCSLRE